MKSYKHILAAAAGFAMLATAGTAVAAPFTFNPSLSSPALSNAGPFTADNMIFSLYSSIDILTNNGSTNGNFSESGILRVANFQSNGQALFPPGFAGMNGANPYGLYLTFVGTGTSTGAQAGATGNFTSLSVNFYGDVGNDNGSISVSQTGATFSGNTGNDVLLATGTLVKGTVGLAQNPNAGNPGSSPVLPSAFALVRFTDATGAGGFFVNPTTMQFDLNSSFTNSDSVTSFAQTSTDVTLTIRGGGGNGTLTNVPEPASLALLGAGLAAVGLVRRRRA